MSAGVSFRELLGYIDGEDRRWAEWFGQQPAALDVEVGIGDADTARFFIRHMFGVTLRAAERLLAEPLTPDDKIDTASADSLFATGETAHRKLRRFLERTPEQDMVTPRPFESATLGRFTASPAKLVTHAVVHEIRHWAQLATALRQHGYKTDWRHDVLFSDAMR